MPILACNKLFIHQRKCEKQRKQICQYLSVWYDDICCRFVHISDFNGYFLVSMFWWGSIVSCLNHNIICRCSLIVKTCLTNLQIAKVIIFVTFTKHIYTLLASIDNLRLIGTTFVFHKVVIFFYIAVEWSSLYLNLIVFKKK